MQFGFDLYVVYFGAGGVWLRHVLRGRLPPVAHFPDFAPVSLTVCLEPAIGQLLNHSFLHHT